MRKRIWPRVRKALGLLTIVFVGGVLITWPHWLWQQLGTHVRINGNPANASVYRYSNGMYLVCTTGVPGYHGYLLSYAILPRLGYACRVYAQSSRSFVAQTRIESVAHILKDTDIFVLWGSAFSPRIPSEPTAMALDRIPDECFHTVVMKNDGFDFAVDTPLGDAGERRTQLEVRR